MIVIITDIDHLQTFLSLICLALLNLNFIIIIQYSLHYFVFSVKLEGVKQNVAFVTFLFF